jgi:hypothetical protein
MVRPRASDRNMKVATAFGGILVISMDRYDFNSSEDLIPLIGRRSIHNLLNACLPSMTRDIRDKSPPNRAGVTVVELNKALHGSGFKFVRR